MQIQADAPRSNVAINSPLMKTDFNSFNAKVSGSDFPKQSQVNFRGQQDMITYSPFGVQAAMSNSSSTVWMA